MGCAYLAAERNGAMFPSTREVWRGREDGKRYHYVYPFLPTGRRITLTGSRRLG